MEMLHLRSTYAWFPPLKDLGWEYIWPGTQLFMTRIQTNRNRYNSWLLNLKKSLYILVPLLFCALGGGG
jgi:hypothetical protein